MEKQYKDTLNMPQSDFSMKADLNTKESQYRKMWLEKEIYQKALNKNKGKKQYVLHDGPPYANGNIHLGHALNKIIKDIIVRYKTMQGFYSPYVPGWDTHGLPIENKMLSEMKLSHKEISTLDIRKAAAKYAFGQMEIQKEQFMKLQMLADFKDIYYTMKPEFEAKQLELIKKMALDGLLFKALKPVYWSPSSQSALAEAEVEYAEHRSPSIFVTFKIVKGSEFVLEGDNLVIWTTTPWTLVANSGVAVGEEFDYSRVKVGDKFFILATEMLKTLPEEFKWESFEVINSFKGKDISGIEYQRPIKRDKTAPVVLGHHVTLDAGSGLVHMAPLFGEDDFRIGKKEKLDMIMHINDDGTLNSEGEQWEGLFYEDVNKHVGMFLDEKGEILRLKFIKHSYPHDWRTHLPVMYRGTPQWFVSIDKIKDKIVKAIDDVVVYHDWAKKRISQMIENREEWTISRQRAWGVPITIFYDENKEPVLEAEVFDYVIDLVRKHGSDIWYEKSVDELLPEKYRGRNWTKENDIMDVWFDSGSTSIGVEIEGATTPFDLYFEGSDQYRGWFNSSLINSVVYRNAAPYKELLSHGFIVDAKGNKMSKSLGNGVDPLELIEKYGADILRLWIANSEYSSDVAYSPKIFEQNIEIYRKIRNTIKFLLGNLYDFDPSKKYELTSVHALIDEKTKKLKNNIIKNYDSYKFIQVIKEVNNFIIENSGFYLSITKDSLYADKLDSNERRQIQQNFYNIAKVLILALAPIIPTTAEEAYSYMNLENKLESVHLEDFFAIEEIKTNHSSTWEEFFNLKDEIYKLIEEKIKEGSIKRQNEARVTIKTDSDFIKSLDLKNLLMVGDVEFGDEMKVEIFESQKCQRCWNHFKENDMNGEICQRCFEVLNK